MYLHVCRADLLRSAQAAGCCTVCSHLILPNPRSTPGLASCGVFLTSPPTLLFAQISTSWNLRATFSNSSTPRWHLGGRLSPARSPFLEGRNLVKVEADAGRSGAGEALLSWAQSCCQLGRGDLRISKSIKDRAEWRMAAGQQSLQLVVPVSACRANKMGCSFAQQWCYLDEEDLGCLCEHWAVLRRQGAEDAGEAQRPAVTAQHGPLLPVAGDDAHEVIPVLTAALCGAQPPSATSLQLSAV